jgi:branched-chain amino acid transport system permease protein
MSNFLQFTVFGIMLGAGYAIAATGLVVTYTTSGVFNFATSRPGLPC